MRKKPTIKGVLGILTKPERFYENLIQRPDVFHYIGQSKSVGDRWLTYLQSGFDKKKHKNCLDRVNLRSKRLILRLLDWDVDFQSLDAAERCSIWRYQPNLNVLLTSSTEACCQVPIAHRKQPKVSGIYQLIVVPASLLSEERMVELPLPDVQKFIQLDLKAKPSREKGYICLKPLKFTSFGSIISNFYGK